MAKIAAEASSAENQDFSPQSKDTQRHINKLTNEDRKHLDKSEVEIEELDLSYITLDGRCDAPFSQKYRRKGNRDSKMVKARGGNAVFVQSSADGRLALFPNHFHRILATLY